MKAIVLAVFLLAVDVPGQTTQGVQLPLSGRTGQNGGVVVTQTPTPGVTSSVNTLNTNVQVQGPYTGSVPSGPLPGALTLKDAIRRGLAHNLGSIGLNNAVRQSHGQSRVARSGLLPNLSANLRENVQQTNLAAFGFSLPNAPSIVGPFNYFDLRATLTQTVADFTMLNNYRAAQANAESAAHSAQDARDLVVFAVAGAYMQVLTTRQRIDSVQAQIESARTIFSQLQEQKNAGVVAQLDVSRSRVELQTQQQRLLALQNDLAKQKINLARLVALAPTPNFELADTVPFTPAPDMTVELAMAEARQSRADLKAAETQVRAAERARAAAGAERLPSLAFSTDYGVIGKNPARSHGTFTVVGSLRIPIWQGGRVEGAIAQADAAVDQRRAELEDLRGRVEAEIRAAFLDLDSSRSQMEVARSNQDLARETLQLARERLDVGITTTVEVVQAQQSIAAADLDYITTVYAYNMAKLALARALGKAEENVARFLPIP
ncbi:MAG TPA: TolC family protein [Bryobacteraceae bacterium]|nr:TolC family protein [Bryobacteraceae bacterium]